jgi:hypothetical protein
MFPVWVQGVRERVFAQQTRVAALGANWVPTVKAEAAET